jgi:chromosome segregation ATPase
MASSPRHNEVDIQCQQRILALQSQYQKQVSDLTSLFDSRLRNVATYLASSVEQMHKDDVLAAMQNNPVSMKFVKARITEIIEATISSEREHTIKQLSLQIAAAQTELKHAHSEAVTQRQQVESLNTSQLNTSKHVDELQAKQDDTSAALVKALEDAAASQRQIASLERQLASARDDGGTLLQQNQDHESQITELRAEVARLTEELEKQKLETLTARHQAEENHQTLQHGLNAREREAAHEIASMQNQHQDEVRVLKEDCAQLKQENAFFQKQLDEARAKSSSAEDRVLDLQSQAQRLEAHSENIQSILKQSEDERLELRDKYLAVGEKLKMVLAQRDASKTQQYQQLERKYRALKQQVRSERVAADKDLEAVTHEAEEVKKQLTVKEDALRRIEIEFERTKYAKEMADKELLEQKHKINALAEAEKQIASFRWMEQERRQTERAYEQALQVKDSRIVELERNAADQVRSVQDKIQQLADRHEYEKQQLHQKYQQLADAGINSKMQEFRRSHVSAEEHAGALRRVTEQMQQKHEEELNVTISETEERVRTECETAKQNEIEEVKSTLAKHCAHCSVTQRAIATQRQLNDELRTRLNVALHDAAKEKKTREQTAEQLNTSTVIVDELKAKIDEKDKLLEETRTASEENNLRARRAEQDLHTANSQLELETANNQEHAQRLRNLEEHVRHLESQRREMTHQIQVLQQQSHDLTEEKEHTQQSLTAQLEQTRRKAEQLRVQDAEFCNRLRAEVDKLTESNERLQQSLEDEKALAHNTRMENERQAKETESSMRDEQRKLELELQKVQQQLVTVSDAKKAVEQNLESATAQLLELRKQIEQLDKKLWQKDAEIREAHTAKDRVHVKQENIRRQLHSRFSKQPAQLRSAVEGLKGNVRDFLGEVQSQMSRGLADAVQQVQFKLRVAKNHEVRAIQEQHTTQLDALRSELRQKDDELRSQFENMSHSIREAEQELRRQLTDHHSELRQAESKASATEQELRNQIRCFEDQRDAAKRDATRALDKQQSVYRDLKSKHEIMVQEQARLEATTRQQRSDLDMLKQQLNAKETELQREHLQLEDARAKVQRLEMSQAQVSREDPQIPMLKSQVADLENRLRQSVDRREIDDIERKNRSKMDDMQRELTKARDDVESKQRHIRKLEDEIDELKRANAKQRADSPPLSPAASMPYSPRSVHSGYGAVPASPALENLIRQQQAQISMLQQQQMQQPLPQPQPQMQQPHFSFHQQAPLSPSPRVPDAALSPSPPDSPAQSPRSAYNGYGYEQTRSHQYTQLDIDAEHRKQVNELRNSVDEANRKLVQRVSDLCLVIQDAAGDSPAAEELKGLDDKLLSVIDEPQEFQRVLVQVRRSLLASAPVYEPFSAPISPVARSRSASPSPRRSKDTQVRPHSAASSYSDTAGDAELSRLKRKLAKARKQLEAERAQMDKMKRQFQRRLNRAKERLSIMQNESLLSNELSKVDAAVPLKQELSMLRRTIQEMEDAHAEEMQRKEREFGEKLSAQRKHVDQLIALRQNRAQESELDMSVAVTDADVDTSDATGKLGQALDSPLQSPQSVTESDSAVGSGGQTGADVALESIRSRLAADGQSMNREEFEKLIQSSVLARKASHSVSREDALNASTKSLLQETRSSSRSSKASGSKSANVQQRHKSRTRKYGSSSGRSHHDSTTSPHRNSSVSGATAAGPGAAAAAAATSSGPSPRRRLQSSFDVSDDLRRMKKLQKKHKLETQPANRRRRASHFV